MRKKFLSMILAVLVLLFIYCNKGNNSKNVVIDSHFNDTNLDPTIIFNSSENMNQGQVGYTSKATEDNKPQEQKEIVNNVQNGDLPLQIVIRICGGVDTNYIDFNKITEVNKSEIDLEITIKNLDIMSFQDAEKLNQPEISVACNQKDWEAFTKNPVPLPNTVHYGICLNNLSNKICDVTINEIFDKNHNQILIKPIAFTLKISDELKSLY